MVSQAFLVFLSLLLFVCLPSHLAAQEAKKALDHDVYELWNRITERSISNDGEWVLYITGPENGDSELHVTSLSSETAYQVSRGSNASFTDDALFVVFHINPAKEDVRQAKRDRKETDEMPKDTLGILDLQSGEIIRMAHIQSFKLPEEAGKWVAVHMEEPPAVADSAATTEPEEPEKEEKKSKGAPLILRNLVAGDETRVDHVTEYLFSRDGRYLAYSASEPEGMFAMTMASGEVDTLLTDSGDYGKPVFDEEGEKLAFLAAGDSSLYLWHTSPKRLDTLVTPASEEIPEGWWVSPEGVLSFSEKGSRLYFGMAPQSKEEEEDDNIDDEKVVLDVWSWKDPLLQSMQLQSLEREQERTYRAVVHLTDGSVVQLADEDVPEVRVGRKGEAEFALAHTNLPYSQQISWDWPSRYDVYGVDVQDGSRRLLLTGVQSSVSLSPDAHYITWWDREQRAWMALATEGGDPVNLTTEIPHAFANELHDWPYQPSSYGTAGWTRGDEEFLVYDRYDIWALDPTGVSTPRNITEGQGRAQSLRFRYLMLDDEEAIDPEAPLLLSALDEATKAGGFYRDHVAGMEEPEQLVMMDRRFSFSQKAEDADQLLFTRESFVEFPDLWTSGLDMTDMRRISAVNPQQAEYLWGTAELVEWISLDGQPLQGMPYKPEGFDPSQKYPMIVYFYEKMSDGLHQHRPPAVARSSISFSFYVSRGYLVFVPDILYRIGYPGESALHAVVPGVTKLVGEGFVQKENIGVQGHSWGGYQIAYMVTETNLFRAAEAGAPVSNMTSAYGGIRWKSGMSRMFQYEKSQSRIGGTLWEYPMRYIDNSPLFQADKVETPVLMMHNDEDGAVPWYQGIEFFVALRRLGKPAWMLNYNGEAHGLQKYHNKRDFAIRMQQFFDHYLKRAPAPVWMEKGIPAMLKGKTLGLETVEEQ